MDRPIPIPWWRTPRAKALWLLGGVPPFLLGIGLVLHAAADGGLRVARADVTIATVRADLFHDYVPLHGTVEPKDMVYLDALAGGQVAELLVQAGDVVAQGQPLIVFRNEQLELNVLDNAGRLIESMTQVQAYLTQLEINRAGNQKALADIRYNIATLEHTARRYDPLLRDRAIAALTVEQVHDQLDHYRRLEDIQAATNRQQEALRLREVPGLQAAQSSLERSLAATQAQLHNLTVRAPVAGRITQLGLKIGENKVAGQRLAEIVPDTGFKVRAEVDEYYIGRVRLGQMGIVTLDGVDHPLRVSRVYPAVKNGSLSIDLAFVDAPPPDLSPGATVEGRLSLGSDSAAILLPAGAFLDASGGDYVFVLDGGGRRAERRQVKLGRRNQDQVVVVSGLRPGERVITSDYGRFGTVQRINLTE
ncbi:efflux RND transporter periplasmic adaptor subunit [Nitrospirillum iridis]|uniref:HlyD family secretion protein n=1 Tax=Nitrospirillum iridis TaxID=765888 RepID=A0A7X0B3I6_9PROT|nr:efflux RND transporter periplasmic adaptor subunit [Nitrospirillum iridis]MBB6255080.1 HlyD family secretion protein [Nitrospirillum iridis]